MGRGRGEEGTLFFLKTIEHLDFFDWTNLLQSTPALGALA